MLIIYWANKCKNDDVDSKSMPSNGLSISNSDIIGEYDHVVPDFVENENWANEEGSDFTSGNEGQVWTDKSVEKVINKDGQIVQDKFKITLFAKVFHIEQLMKITKNNDME